MLINDILSQVRLPAYRRAENTARGTRIEKRNIAQALSRSIEDGAALKPIGRDAGVAIAVGSREIANLPVIVTTLVSRLKAVGARPFIVPAMGSHGGATAEGQEEVLRLLGVDEQTVGAPVRSSMEVDYLGVSEAGAELYLDRIANSADFIIPVARVKPHTDFHGEIESGIMKMLTVGLGKQKGAQSVHARGWEHMIENIKAGAIPLIKRKVPFAIGIVENGWHETVVCEAIPADEIYARERELLVLARQNMLKIPFEKIDVLILERMGKDISGSGMDPNVVGRSSILGRSAPFADCIAVFDLTDASHGNATGVGKANVITERLFRKIDKSAMYLNGLTGSDMRGLEIPVVMPDDLAAYRAALRPCWGVIWKTEPRVVWMRDTLNVYSYYVSENLCAETKQPRDVVISNERFAPNFDSNGNFTRFSSILAR